jgi:hypothetical protein
LFGGFLMRRFCLSLAALLTASAAHSETLRVVVMYPAASDEAASLRSVQVESFGGNAGEDLTIQTEDGLRAINLGKGPWLRVIPAATGGGGEALLRGTADTEQHFTDFTEQHERCIKDADGKCTSAKEKITVRCRRRNIELVVQLRLIDRDGTLLWSDNRPEVYQDSHCEDAEGSPRARNSIARELNGKVARRVRLTFAPRRETEDVRVDENRKGLNKDDSAAFKDAVKWTKQDNEVACQIWEGLAERNPNHAPTQYNVGLCAESGDGTVDTLAQQRYARTLALNPKHAMAQRGLERIAATARSERQFAAHEAQ